jgi:LPS-assembly lipoprotein
MLRTFASIAILVFLGGCGFALRGTAELPASLQPLYIENIDSSSPMGRELFRVLANNKVALADEAATDRYSLAVGNETSSERALSVNANARAGEYELTLGILYQLRRNGAAVGEAVPLQLSKVYLADPENAIAKTEEAELIRTEMRRELALLILRRLQSFKP